MSRSSPKPSFRIRPARESDLGSLVDLLSALFSIETDFKPHPEKERRGLKRLLREREKARVLVAVKGEKVIGMVTGQLIISTAEGAKVAWLEDLIVQPPFHRLGVGTALLDGIVRWMRSRGAKRVQLLADKENEPARLFYAARGLHPTKLIALRRML